MQSVISTYDFILVPIYILLFYFIAKSIRKKNHSKIHYEYFLKGFWLKLFGVSLFSCFYIFYYETGDTISYFVGSRAIFKAITNDFNKGLHILLNIDSPLNNWNSFNALFLPPFYMYRDETTFNVSRISTLFYILSCGSYFVTSFFTALFAFSGSWKFYSMVNEIYPNNEKKLFYCILCIPSILFWGSGIMKDSYVLGASLWVTTCFYKVFIKRYKILINLVLGVLFFSIIINTKSYIAVSLIPGMLLWLNFQYLKSIKNRALKALLTPVLILIFVIVGASIFSNLESIGLGAYQNVDETIVQAQVIQQDLLREEQYGSNHYNIGEIDGTISGILKIAPLAIFTAIYRPFIWETGSVIMVFTALENLVLLVLTFVLIIKLNPIILIKNILSHPLLLYMFVFVLFLGTGVGIASTNFGALARYKVPILPFYYSLFVLNMYIVKKTRL